MALVSSKAQDENLKMKFDFSNVSGTSVKDDVSGITATVMSSAKVMNMGKYKVLDLGNGTGYLNMTAAAGKVFSQNDDFTISVYYRVDEAASLSGTIVASQGTTLVEERRKATRNTLSDDVMFVISLR